MNCPVGSHGSVLNSLDPAVHELYDALYQQQNTLDAKWQEFRKLYMHSEERGQLLHRTADYFFGLLKMVLWQDVLLHTAKLIDSEATGGKANLTVRRLPSAVSDPALSSRLASLVQTAKSKCAVAREWRHKQLAHLDLNLSLGTAGTTLTEVDPSIIEDGLASIRAILSELDPTVGLGEPWVSQYGDAERLVRYLEHGVEYEEERRRSRRSRST
ncbi:MAG TPA: hypothetical protein VFH48_15410 [Chloroflexota bacterium]|nr:hypothetical protein [Chloroflexota bacterium]